MNDQYTHYLKSAYYAHVAPGYPVAAGYTQPPRPRQVFALTEIDTGASLGSLVDDLHRVHELNQLYGYAEVDRRIRAAFSSNTRRSDVWAARWWSGDEVLRGCPRRSAWTRGRPQDTLSPVSWPGRR